MERIPTQSGFIAALESLGGIPSYLSWRYKWLWDSQEDGLQEMLVELYRVYCNYRPRRLPEEQLKKLMLTSLYNKIKDWARAAKAQKRSAVIVPLDSTNIPTPPTVYNKIFCEQLIRHAKEMLSELDNKVLDEVLYSDGAYLEAYKQHLRRRKVGGQDRVVQPSVQSLAKALKLHPITVGKALNRIYKVMEEVRQ